MRRNVDGGGGEGVEGSRGGNSLGPPRSPLNFGDFPPSSLLSPWPRSLPFWPHLGPYWAPRLLSRFGYVPSFGLSDVRSDWFIPYWFQCSCSPRSEISSPSNPLSEPPQSIGPFTKGGSDVAIRTPNTPNIGSLSRTKDSPQEPLPLNLRCPRSNERTDRTSEYPYSRLGYYFLRSSVLTSSQSNILGIG